MEINDTYELGGKEFSSRYILGSGKYSVELIDAAIHQAGAEMITVAIRHSGNAQAASILKHIPKNITLLPNTNGATNVEEAVKIARLAREMGCGNFVKLEIMRDRKYLLPDNYATIQATEILAKEGFVVLPYMYPDLQVAYDLKEAGASAIMPLAAPIGSNKGLVTKEFIRMIIKEIDLPVIVDAGIGVPSQAAEVMEMGATAVMANTGVATANDILLMAKAFKLGIEAGRAAYLAGPGRVLLDGAAPSSPKRDDEK
ncbi:thiazole synthase [Aerococcus christensenii]|nr:thiazole synthase [Aerococcus christensenii]MDK8234591.1 thiazole synthase [Aerococcus christensenii]